jgi:hypothetical protein
MAKLVALTIVGARQALGVDLHRRFFIEPDAVVGF